MSLKRAYTCKYVTSRYKIARALEIVLHAIYKKGYVFKYLNVFQCNNGSEFKSVVKKLLEQHNVDARRTTRKFKDTHTHIFFKRLLKISFSTN